jgi:hypothetical protein
VSDSIVKKIQSVCEYRVHSEIDKESIIVHECLLFADLISYKYVSLANSQYCSYARYDLLIVHA